MGNKGDYVRGWKVDTRELLWELPSHHAALCSDGKAFVDQKKDNGALFELPSGKEIRSWEAGDEDLSFTGEQRFSAKGDLLVRRYYRQEGPKVLLGWDIAKGEKKFAHDIDVDMDRFALLSDGKRAAVMDRDGGLFIYDLETGKRLKTLDEKEAGTRDPRNFATCSADGKYFLVSVFRKEAEVRSQETLEVLHLIPKETGSGPGGRPLAVNPVAVIPGTTFALDSSGSSSWTIWNYESGERIANLETESHGARHLAVSPDGRWLATGDVEGKIFIWDLTPLHKPDGKLAASSTAKEKPLPPVKIVKRTWSSKDGKFKTKALLEKIDGENVVLRREDDTVKSVPLDLLSTADRKYVESVRPQLETPKTEIKPAAELPYVLAGPVEPPQPVPPVKPTTTKNPNSPELSKVEGISIRRSESQKIAYGTITSGAGLEGNGIEGTFPQRKLGEVFKSLSHPAERVFGANHLPQDLYDIEIHTTKDRWVGALRAYCEAVEKAVGMPVRLEEREVPILVLRRGPDWEKKGFTKVAEGRGFSGGGSFLGRPITAEFRGDMDYLAEKLESTLKQPVVNDSKIVGFYDAKWEYKEATATADITKYLAEHGLVLAAEPGKIEGVFIDKPKE
jgi:hypothetical protein